MPVRHSPAWRFCGRTAVERLDSPRYSMTLHSRLSGLRSISLALGLFLLAGCSKSDRTEVYPVSGKVLYDGKPMEGGGSIAFVPTGKGTGKAPGGIIDPQGDY